MTLATRLELVAKEITCLQARLDERAEAHKTSEAERQRLEWELLARDERIATLEEQLAEALERPSPEAAPLPAPMPAPLPPTASAPLVAESAPRPSGILGRFKRGKKTDDVPAPDSREAEFVEEEELESVPEPEPITPPSEPTIVAKRFAPQEFLSRLPDLDDTQLDLLNFGVAQLDDEGIVVAINLRESVCTGVSRPDAMDIDYFGEALSTADGASLRKKLRQGAAKGKLDVPVLTNLNEGEETVRAIVHLYRHSASKTNWALIRRESDGK